MTLSLGTKTDEPNLNSMHAKLITIFLLSAPLLWGAPPNNNREIYEVRSAFQELSYRLNSHQTELDLLLERLNTLEGKIPRANPSNGRLAALESSQKNLADDFKVLKSHLEKTNSSLHKCEKQLANLDKQLTTDIASLKNSLKSMIALLQGGEKLHIVKPGDSLGQIALQHKVSTKTLKEYNNLKSDTIIIGQKIKLP